MSFRKISLPPATPHVRQASDVSSLPKAPDVVFHVRQYFITAEVDGFSVDIRPFEGSTDKALVEVALDGVPYCRCIYIDTPNASFSEESFTEEVTGFACGIIWSAWRRRELDRGES